MKQVNESEALALLKAKPSTFVSFQMETAQDCFNLGRDTKANPKGSMISSLNIDPEKIIKHTTLTGLVGTKVSYQSLVENRLAKESDLKGIDTPDFESKGRKWGERIDGVEVVHNELKYITIYFVANNIPKVTYTYEGVDLDIKDAKFDPYRKPEKAEGALQGLDKPIVPRDYKLSSVNAMTLSGETYILRR